MTPLTEAQRRNIRAVYGKDADRIIAALEAGDAQRQAAKPPARPAKRHAPRRTQSQGIDYNSLIPHKLPPDIQAEFDTAQRWEGVPDPAVTTLPRRETFDERDERIRKENDRRGLNGLVGVIRSKLGW